MKLPDGETIKFASLVKKPGTNIVALLDKHTILLDRQYRPAIKKWIYELPGGKIEKGETPAHNAFRELEEETGYKASKMELLLKLYNAPHVSNDFQYIFLATGLKKTKQHLERGEIIKLCRIKIRDLDKMIEKGRITDAATIVGLMLFLKRARV